MPSYSVSWRREKTWVEYPHKLVGKHVDILWKKTGEVHGATVVRYDKYDETHELEYDERNPFVINCADLKPIYRGAPLVRCAFCNSAYLPEYKGKVCVTCGVSLVGVETLGLVTMGQASRR